MKHRRNTSGFTLTEMLIAVAIMVILMGVAFVAVINYQKSMKQLELDRTAREIFVAAQNHLTMAEGQGLLKDADPSNLGEQPAGITNRDEYCFFVAPEGILSQGTSMLVEMLPPFSIDDTVRVGGSYVIKYDAKTATILDVFYSDQSNLSTHTFVAGDYDNLFPGCVGAEQANKDARLNFGGTIIGWYGGDDLGVMTPADLAAPELKVNNAERLEVEVHITDPTPEGVSGPRVQVIMTGDKSGSQRKIADEPLSAFLTEPTKKYILDDITAIGKHFADLWCTDDLLNPSNGVLIPGENITLQAIVYSNETLSTIAKSPKRHTNSLFADVIEDKSKKPTGAEALDANAAKPTMVAQIANIRHLENLDAAISGYDLKSLDEAGATYAKQVGNLRWIGGADAFANKIFADDEGNAASDEQAGKVQIHYLSGDVATTKAGAFAPVNPTSNGESYQLNYDGDGYAVAGVRVDNAAEAGMFGQVTGGSIKNLKLTDFTVVTSGGNAGTLAGTLANTSVQGVAAYDEAATSGGIDARGVTATANAGGLVGTFVQSGSTTGGATSIADSAAAVYVRSTGTSNASAGGLVGATTGTVSVRESHAGGHTVDGLYLREAPSTQNVNKIGRLNVQAQLEAGGLVGKATGTTTIQNSYATCSAYGATVGGLAGSVASGSAISKCYATGFVLGTSGSASLGAFVGTGDGVTFADDQYLAITNQDADPAIQALASGANNNILAADRDLDSYRAFFSTRFSASESLTSAQNKQKAVAYDSTLTRNYNGQYPYKSSGELADANYSAESTHYGDWPSSETNTLNVRGMGAGSTDASTTGAAHGVNVQTAHLAGAGAGSTLALPLIQASETPGLSTDTNKTDGSDASGNSSSSATYATNANGQSFADSRDGGGSTVSVESTNAGSTANDASSSQTSGTTQSGEATAEQGTKTLSKSIKSADGHTYTVSVTYDGSANVPDGAKLEVVELNRLPDDWNDEEKQRTTYKDRPLATERLLDANKFSQRSELLGKTLDMGDDDKLTWSKFFDVSIVADGEKVEPAADVTVEVQTNAVAAQASDALEMARLDGDESARLEVTNETGTKEGEDEKKPEELQARIRAKTGKLGELAIAQVVQKKFGWQLFGSAISVFGPRSVEVTPYEMPLEMSYANGSRLISIVGVTAQPTRSFGTYLWVGSASVEGEQDQTGHVVVNRLYGNNESARLIEKRDQGLASFGAGDLLALLWESDAPTTLRLMSSAVVQPQDDPEDGYSFVMTKSSTALLSQVFEANHIEQGTTDVNSVEVEGANLNLSATQQADSDWLLATDEGFVASATLTVKLVEGESITIAIKPGYGITWNDYDGTLLKTTAVEPDAMPSYGGDNPTRESDDQYRYAFAGWNPDVVAATADATYTARYDATPLICKIGDERFATLNEAMAYAHTNLSGQATIQMLCNYTVAASDAVEILSADHITLTSATGGPYTLTCAADLTSQALFANAGSLSLENVIVDGNSVESSVALVTNTGTLTAGAGATLRNAWSTADGGVVRSTGTVRIEGATLQSNHAANGGAIYAASGSVYVDSGTLSGNVASANGGAIYMQSGTMEIAGGTASGNSAVHGGFAYMANGVVTADGATLESNVATGNGGALYVGAGSLEVASATLQRNQAANGGAVSVDTATLTIGGSAQITGNTASANGGAAYANKGGVTVKESASLAGNTASASGGAIYAQEAEVSISGGALTGNTAATDGGALYAASGVVSVTAGSIQQNIATSGNGGALYAGLGRVTLTGASLTNNTAATNGGAAYVGSGTASVSSIAISQNTATNGSALFVNSGSASLEGGAVVSNNVSTSGGAVGVGSDTARLTFAGNVQVASNKLGSADATQQSNVYLDQNKDTVVNIGSSGVESSASVGVYVADGVLTARGVPGAAFGSYASSSNYTAFTNDRTTSLVARTGSNNKLVWGSPIRVQVRYVASFANGFPPISGARVVYPSNDYYPSTATMGASDIGAALYSNFVSQCPTAGFAGAFASSATLFGEYVTQVKWSTQTNTWSYVRRNGTEVPATEELVLYYSEPTYVSIENNTAFELDLSALSVLGATAINSSETAGYGFVVAKNGATQSTLLPIAANDLKLGANKSIRLLFPGAGGAAYSFTGKYTGSVAEPIHLRRTGETEEYISAWEATTDAGFTRSGTTVATTGSATEIVFGGDKPICKIVAPGNAIGTVAEGQTVGQSEPDASGNVEYLFSTMMQAVAFVQAHETAMTKTATIQMLVDYLMPGTDAVVVPAGYNLTFTTATSGEFQYEASEGKSRATISRDASNTGSFITATSNDDAGTVLTVSDLNFDGKALVGKGDGGAVNTKNCKTTITNADFSNFNAGNGGAVYANYSTSGGTYVVTDVDRQTFTVTHANFSNCISSSTESRQGGGAIWTNAKHFVLDGGTGGAQIESCTAIDQGGAVFHRIDSGYSAGTTSTIRNYTFTSCEANAAGGMECDAQDVVVEGCSFAHCKSRQRNGGALNIYSRQQAEPSVDCTLRVTSCHFTDCHANKAGSNMAYGGGVRSTAKETTIQDCTFTNVTAVSSGGGISASNKNAASLTVSGCTFSETTSSDKGGAVYCYAKVLVVGDYTKSDNTVVHTSISKGSASGSGGGIYHIVNTFDGSSASLANVTISGCTTPYTGAGVYSGAKTLTIEGGEIYGNTSTGDGAGVWYESGNRKSMTLTLRGANIHNNTAGGHGGGVYTKAAKLVVGARQVGDSTVRTRIANNVAAKQGGGIGYFNYNENSTTSEVTIEQCDITGNRANGKADNNASGGGVYANSGKFSATDCVITGNVAAGSGGGICRDNYNGTFGLIGGQVSGNIAAVLGGGIWTRSSLSAVNASITGNRLSTNDAQSAAGVYIADNMKLIVGTEGASETDTTTIKNNTTASGTASNLRLWEASGNNSTSSVQVHCGLSGEIHVVNAKSVGTQFGSSDIANPAGFVKDTKTGQVPVFTSDDGKLYGAIDRLDESGKKIIWATDPVCKITDPNGELLYFKRSDTSDVLLPAVFDKLDNGKGNGNGNADKKGAFSILKYNRANLKLYYADGTQYGDDVSENEFHVRMLVPEYTANNYIGTNSGNQSVNNTAWMKIVLTTASTTDDDGYPYRGSAGTRATITRGASVAADKSLINALVCVTFTNIVLDGGATGGVQTTANGVLVSNTSSQYTTIEVGQNATLQNGKTTKDGGAVFANFGNVKVNGGTIQNCEAGGKGGAINMESFYKTTGDPVRGMLDILEGSKIEKNTAANGGGVFIGGNARVTMTGGEIANNNATTKGGGIAFDANNNTLYFSGTPTVRNNKLNGTECNVCLDKDTNNFINSNGIEDGASIGIYVSDGTALYDKHGDEGKPFGKYASGTSTSALYGFVNDRNGLVGGLINSGEANTVYWVVVHSLRVSKALQSGLAADASKQFTFVVELLTEAGQVDTSVNKTISGVTFEGGVSRPIRLRGGMYKLLQDLPINQRFRVLEQLDAADAQAFDTTPGTTIEGRIETQTTKQGSERYITDAAFTNTRKTGQLTVSKAVISDEEADKQEGFAFKVTLAGLTEQAANQSYGGLQFTNGESEEFTLTDGQSRTLSGLPSDARFTVEEVLSSDRQSYYTTIPVLTQNNVTLNESPSPSRSQAGLVVEGESQVAFTNRKNISFTVSKQWAESVANQDDLEVDFELYKVKARPGDARWGQTGYDVPDLPDALVDLSYVWEDHVEPTSNVDIGQTFKFFKYNGKYYYFQISGQTYYNENLTAEEFLNAYVRNEDSSPIVMYTGRVWDLDMLKQGIADGTYRIYNNSIWMSTSPDPSGDKVHIAIGDLIFYNNQYYLVAKGADFPLFYYDQNTGEYTFAASGRVGPNNNLRAVEVTGGSQSSGSSSSTEVVIEYSEQATAEGLVNSLTDPEHNYEVTAVPNTAADAVDGGYYTLNADNGWSITFDDLDYRYDYYAVEWHVRPKGDHETELRDNFVTTYDYVQGDHATIINTPAGSREVILRKVGQASSGNYVSLAGARFRIYNDNGTQQGGSEITVGRPDGQDYYESTNPSGIYFVGTLPYGKYKIVETAYPAGYEPVGYNANDPTTWFYYLLTVDEDGSRIEGPKAYDGSDLIPPEAAYAIVLNPEGVHDGVYYEGQDSVNASLQMSVDGGKSYRAVESTVAWSTSNAAVVSVSNNGTLTIGNAGTATITAVGADTEGNPVTAYKQIEVRKSEDTSISTTDLKGIIGPYGVLSAPGVITFTYTVNGQPASLAGHTLTFDGYDSSLIDVSAVLGVATVTYKASGNTSINVSFDGQKLYTVKVEVAEVELKTTSLTNKTAGTTEQNAIQVEYKVGGSDRSSEVASHLDYEYDTATYGVAEVLVDKLSVDYKKAGTTQVGVKFDGTQIGRITITVNEANPLTDLSRLFDIKQGTKELVIEGNTSTVDVYTWPKDAAGEYLASTNYNQSESVRQLNVPAGRVFEQDGVYYYFKESVPISLGDLSWHSLNTIRGWGLQDKILVVTEPNGESDGGGSSAAPTDNSIATAEQAVGSAIVDWADGNTWHNSSDGTYLYASSNSDNCVALVYYNGHYYVPKSYGNATRLDATMFADSFEVSHLTDGVEHAYSPESNPGWTVPITWVMTH